MGNIEEAILSASAKLAAIDKANCIELWVHPTPEGLYYADVARFYAVETCRGRYVVPFHLHKAPTLSVGCFGGDGREHFHEAPVRQVVWPLGYLDNLRGP